MEELKLPELGEGIETVDVTAVLVSVGEVVRSDQPLIEVETEKASLEIPAPAGGKIVEVLVSKGDSIRVGQLILRIETGAAASESKAVAPTPEPAPQVAVQAQAAPVLDFPLVAASPEAVPGRPVPAAPSSRALARQLGVDISKVPGSGPGGRISREDVKAYAKRLILGLAASAATAEAPPMPDFTQWGEVERERLSAVRRATARGMATAWSTVPHVTQFDEADVSQLEAMRKQYNAGPDAAGHKLTMTAIVIDKVAQVLEQYPKFNASLDLANEEVIYKNSIHIGVAVDTDRGLLVPVIRDADRKSLLQVADELNDLAERARSKKLAPDEMRGAGFTVTNLGGLGTTYFSPIVNWPEVAILGVGRAKHQPVLIDGQFEPRLMMPLSLSYDHRLIDGADAARCLRTLAEMLEQPLLLPLEE